MPQGSSAVRPTNGLYLYLSMKYELLFTVFMWVFSLQCFKLSFSFLQENLRRNLIYKDTITLCMVTEGVDTISGIGHILDRLF